MVSREECGFSLFSTSSIYKAFFFFLNLKADKREVPAHISSTEVPTPGND